MPKQLQIDINNVQYSVLCYLHESLSTKPMSLTLVLNLTLSYQ